MSEPIETSGEIAREAELSRARLALTLDRLRDNLAPQQLADEVLGNARRGASVVLKSVGESALAHPVPALLIGAASAMLLSAASGLTHASPAARRTVPVPPATPPPNRTGTGARGAPSRRSALGERPVATALLGIVIGRWLGTLLPTAATAREKTTAREKLTAAAAE